MHHEQGGSGRPRGAGHSATGLGHHTPSGLSTCRAAGEGTQGLSKFCEMLTLTHRSRCCFFKADRLKGGVRPPDLPPASGFRFLPQRANLWCERRPGFLSSSHGSLAPLDLARSRPGGCDAMRCGRSWLLLIPCKGHFLHVEVVGEVAKAIASNVSWDSAGFCAHGPFRPCPGTTRRHPAWI